MLPAGGLGRHRRFPGQHAGSGRRRDLGFGPPLGLHPLRGPGIAHGFPLSVGHRLGTADEALIAAGPVAGARAIADGEVDRAIKLLYQPASRDGHPRLGFLFLQLTIAALRQAEVRKVAHVDVDANHDNGVQIELRRPGC